MYRDVEEMLAAKRGQAYEGKFSRGLPFGLNLPSGMVGSTC